MRAVACPLQDTVAEMAQDLARRKGDKTKANELYEFMKRVSGWEGGCTRGWLEG